MKNPRFTMVYSAEEEEEGLTEDDGGGGREQLRQAQGRRVCESSEVSVKGKNPLPLQTFFFERKWTENERGLGGNDILSLWESRPS